MFVCGWSSVDSQLRVRVTDAALSRDLFPADYDRHGGGVESDSRPIRWMALESLVDRRASSASDMVRRFFIWFDAILTAYKQIMRRLTTALTSMEKIQKSLHCLLSDVAHSALR